MLILQRHAKRKLFPCNHSWPVARRANHERSPAWAGAAMLLFLTRLNHDRFPNEIISFSSGQPGERLKCIARRTI